MISAGNDIVALNRINKERTNQRNFYSKILSNPEQLLYHDHISGLPFYQYVWLLWSVKESAYKFLKRIVPGLIFSPTKIIIRDFQLSGNRPVFVPEKENINEVDDCTGTEYNGVVTFEAYSLYFRSKISDQIIASVVDDGAAFKNIWCGTGFIENTSHSYQSLAAKHLLLNKLKTLLPGDLSIGKHPVGYPLIIQNKELVNIPASLAHDGQFVACSINMATLA